MVTVDWGLPKGERKSTAGEVSFISPEVDAINNQVRFWVEFDNADAKIFPGMKVNVRIVSHSDSEKP
jgi:multidrug efflux pump subunit AcrA (membrane-fusion protein)